MKNVSQRGHDIKKAFFGYVNSKLTVRLEIIEMLKENGELDDSEKNTCGILGRYFISVHAASSNEEIPLMDAMYETEIGDLIVRRMDV